MAHTTATIPRLSFLLAATVALLPLRASAPRAQADQEVTVKDGDSLTAIALAYFGDASYAQAIAAYNHLTDSDHLTVGQTLKLPRLPDGRMPGAPLTPSLATDAGAQAAGVPPSPARAGPVIQTGLATWYGPGFEGNLTKCGQVFHESDLTASSNDLPCGTVIQVTNVDNGRSVVVTVDDTGGFQHPTILDLSGAAFRALASSDAGVMQVSVARILA